MPEVKHLPQVERVSPRWDEIPVHRTGNQQRGRHVEHGVPQLCTRRTLYDDCSTWRKTSKPWWRLLWRGWQRELLRSLEVGVVHDSYMTQGRSGCHENGPDENKTREFFFLWGLLSRKKIS